MPFENIVGKGKNAFPTLFFNLPKTNFNFSVTFGLSSADPFSLVMSKNLLFGKGLTLSQTSPVFYVSAVQVF